MSDGSDNRFACNESDITRNILKYNIEELVKPFARRNEYINIYIWKPTRL